jgi:hypothetical protein
MSTRISHIRALRAEVASLNLAKDSGTATYKAQRDSIICAFFPHAKSSTKTAQRSNYLAARERNHGYLETVLYGAIWEDLSPNERLAIEHLYYENTTFVDNNTRLHRSMHHYISAKRSNDQAQTICAMKNALWEVLYHSPAHTHSTLERDKAKHRRKAQATMLNSLNLPLAEIHTPDDIVAPIRLHYHTLPLETLLPDIVFPLEENARRIAEEIQLISAQTLQQIQGQKSMVTQSQTTPEATDAFTKLYTKIIDEDTRTLIDQKLEKLAQAGSTPDDISDAIDAALQHAQDITIPHKVSMLAQHFYGKMTELEQRKAGYSHYIWQAQDDPKVRPSHAANDEHIFSWANIQVTSRTLTKHHNRSFA